jgi:pentatricopeptide repeat-containing protein PET309
MLHSAFWVHGAGELELAAAAAASLFGGGCGGAREEGSLPEKATTPQPPANAPRRRAAFVQLEFLYPPGALSFLRHLGTTIPRRESGGLFPFSGGKREYSSTTQPPLTEYAEVEDINELPKLSCPDDLDIPRPDDDQYKRFDIWASQAPRGQYQAAWFHYCSKWKRWMNDTPEPPNRYSDRKLHEEQTTRRFIARYMLDSVHRTECLCMFKNGLIGIMRISSLAFCGWVVQQRRCVF